MLFDAKGKRMTHAPPDLCHNAAVLQNALKQFPPHSEWFPGHLGLLPGEHWYQKAVCSSGLFHPADKDPRLIQPHKEEMAPSLPVWALAYSLLQQIYILFMYLFIVCMCVCVCDCLLCNREAMLEAGGRISVFLCSTPPWLDCAKHFQDLHLSSHLLINTWLLHPSLSLVL